MKYKVFSKGFIEDDLYSDVSPFKPSLSVHDFTPVWTGLINKDEDPIYRLPNSIGFTAEFE